MSIDTKKLTIFLLIFILFASFFLISYQAKGKLTFSKIHFSQIAAPLTYLKGLFRDFSYLKEENTQLKKQLYEISLIHKSYQELINENKRLKSFLDLKETRKDIVTIAKVISKGSNKFMKTLWIDKGSNQGVQREFPVITFNGLVGKVISVNSNFSEVLLLTDPNFSVAVRIERTRTEGILSGTGNGCLLKYIPLEEEILLGDRIITSGLDDIFPEGILVGAVKSTTKKEGFFQKIDVIPIQKEHNIEEVAVIKKSI
jgi:rod shape-determining protein MreC